MILAEARAHSGMNESAFYTCKIRILVERALMSPKNGNPIRKLLKTYENKNMCFDSLRQELTGDQNGKKKTCVLPKLREVLENF